MRMIPLLVLALLVPACSDDDQSVGSTGSPSPGPQGPSPRLGKLYAGLEGTWDCETTFPEGALGPGAPEIHVPGELTFEADQHLGGYWYRGIYATQPSETMPPFRVEFFLGYGELSELAFLVGVDSMGGTSTGTSAGWQGDVLTYEGHGYVMGQQVGTRESLTMQGAAKVVHRLEVDAGDGYGEKVTTACTR